MLSNYLCLKYSFFSRHFRNEKFKRKKFGVNELPTLKLPVIAHSQCSHVCIYIYMYILFYDSIYILFMCAYKYVQYRQKDTRTLKSSKHANFSKTYLCVRIAGILACYCFVIALLVGKIIFEKILMLKVISKCKM